MLRDILSHLVMRSQPPPKLKSKSLIFNEKSHLIDGFFISTHTSTRNQKCAVLGLVAIASDDETFLQVIEGIELL